MKAAHLCPTNCLQAGREYKAGDVCCMLTKPPSLLLPHDSCARQPAAECPGFVKVGEPLGQPENVVHYQTLLRDCPTLVTDWASVAWWLSKQNCDVSEV